MNDKENYLELMQRYFDAETSPEEEKALALYAASTDDPAFEDLRGVLGYLSIGRQKKAKKVRIVRFYAVTVAASLVLIAAIGLNISNQNAPDDKCIRYAYGEKVEDHVQIMTAVESSLADFFSNENVAEQNLKELLNR